MFHQLPKHKVISTSNTFGGEGGWHFTIVQTWRKMARPSADGEFAAGWRTDSCPPESHLDSEDWGTSTGSHPRPRRAGMRLPTPRQSLPHVPRLCRAPATEAWDERRGMQTSEEPGRPSHEENTANSLLIIQTSGLALSSSWGFKQEAQLRMLAEGGRCLPEPGASSCTWSVGPAAPEDRRWVGCYKHSARPFQNITPVTTTTAPTGHKFTLRPSTHMECANTHQHLTTAACLGGIAHLPHHGCNVQAGACALGSEK